MSTYAMASASHSARWAERSSPSTRSMSERAYSPLTSPLWKAHGGRLGDLEMQRLHRIVGGCIAAAILIGCGGGTDGLLSSPSNAAPTLHQQSFQEKVLHIFAGGTDGAHAESTLTNVKGILYGTRGRAERARANMDAAQYLRSRNTALKMFSTLSKVGRMAWTRRRV